MSIKINANLPSGYTARSDKTSGALQTSLARLSSGKRINSAKDDAAGLAIALRFLNQISGSQQAYRNVNDGISLAQTAEAALQDVNSQTQRLRELAVQSANGSLSDTDRASLQAEASSLQEEISRTVTNTQFNGISLLNNNNSLDFQVGANAGDKQQVSTVDVASQLNSQGLNSIDISTAGGASNAISVADNALDTVAQARSTFGSSIEQFESASRNLENQGVNLSASASRLQDADYAQETAELTRNSILQQAATATAGQANATSQQVLHLLS